MQIQSLGGEDPLEEGMATHSSIVAWRMPWTEEPGGLQSIRSQRGGHNWSDWTSMQHTFSTGQWSTFQEYRNWASPSLEVLMYLRKKSHNLSHNFREIGGPESQQRVPYPTYQPWKKLQGVSSHSSFLVSLSNSILLFLSCCGCVVAKLCPTLLWPHGL